MVSELLYHHYHVEKQFTSVCPPEKLALSSAEKSLMLDEDKLLSIERIFTSFGVVVEFSRFSAILTIKHHQ